MTNPHSLEKVREKIDLIDAEIQKLITQRVQMAKETARLKQQSDEHTADFYRPEREAMVLREVMDRNEGALPNKEMARIFREIMSACLAAERPLEVAFLGPEGSYTQAAAYKHFGGSVLTKPIGTIADVFHAVETGNADYGVVPVENSTEGMVSHTLDRFIASPLKINGEVSLRINHYLLSNEANISDVRTVYAHPQALAQCRQWLNEHLPVCKQVATESNSEAARRVAGEEGCAAIASHQAADIYDLKSLASNIEDEADNTTRFLIIGTQDVAPSGADTTTLLVSTINKPGALQSLLKPLADSDISMSRIESRPSGKGVWEYVFFIDIEGHSHDHIVAKALQNLAEDTSMFRVLGAYPKAVI